MNWTSFVVSVDGEQSRVQRAFWWSTTVASEAEDFSLHWNEGKWKFLTYTTPSAVHVLKIDNAQNDKLTALSEALAGKWPIDGANPPGVMVRVLHEFPFPDGDWGRSALKVEATVVSIRRTGDDSYAITIADEAGVEHDYVWMLKK